MTEFVHLHVHSYYSFFDSTMSPEQIVHHAKATGAKAVALTDINNFTGVVTFYKAAKSCGVKPLLGAEITQPLARERNITASRVPVSYSIATGEADHAFHEKAGCDSTRSGSVSPALCKGDLSTRIMLIARNFVGYSEISHILTRRMLEQSFDVFTETRNLSNNVIAFSDSPEVLSTAAEAGVNIHAMLMPSRRRRGRNRTVYEKARSLNLPVVIGCDAKIVHPEDSRLHTLLQAMRRLTTIYRIPEGDQIDPAQHLQENDAVHAFFGLDGEKPKDELRQSLATAISNTSRIADECNCELPLGEWKFLRFDGLPRPPDTMLAELVERGIRERYGNPPPPEAIERMEYELSVIRKLRFTEYFLLVNRIVEEACARGFNMVGRGSAANSIVSYALRFTNVCPLRYNLYFERFLNPERNVPPDIDIDFSWRERDDILTWCFNFFGHDKVALISTIQTLQSRQAIREVAKAHGIAENEVNAFNRLHETGFRVEENSRAGTVSNLAEEEPWRTILEQARRLTDFPRHLSIHCGGIIISPQNVVDFVPLTTSAKGFVITQMDMYGVEDMGLIKIDLLSNRSLGVLKDTLEMVQRNQHNRESRSPKLLPRAQREVVSGQASPSHQAAGISPQKPKTRAEVFRREATRMKLAGTRRGTSVALAGVIMPANAPQAKNAVVIEPVVPPGKIPVVRRDPCYSLIKKRVFDFEFVTNDLATRALIDSGRTMGCFYIESPGMRALFERLRCRNFEEVVAASSIIRPGVAESGMMQEYITRHQGDPQRREHLTRETQRAGLPGSRSGARVAIAMDMQSDQLRDPRSPTTLVPHGSAAERLAKGNMPINAHAKSRPIYDYIKQELEEKQEHPE